MSVVASARVSVVVDSNPGDVLEERRWRERYVTRCREVLGLRGLCSRLTWSRRSEGGMETEGGHEVTGRRGMFKAILNVVKGFAGVCEIVCAFPFEV